MQHRFVELVFWEGFPGASIPARGVTNLSGSAKGCRPPTEPASIDMNVQQSSLIWLRPDQAPSYEVIESWSQRETF